MTRHFLTKLNVRTHISTGIARPHVAAEWEGAIIHLPPSRLLLGGSGPIVAEGDRLTIWGHETKAHGGGAGLTADARATRVVPTVEGFEVTLSEVHLLQPHVTQIDLPKGNDLGAVLTSMRKFVLTRLVALTPSQSAQFDQQTSALRRKKRELLDAYQAQLQTPINRAIHDEDAHIAADYERCYTLAETRPYQRAFRLALMDRYNACAITRMGYPAVLQAAHIVPFSKNLTLRDDPANGLLLRADIHLLFDSLRLSINPLTMQVAVCPDARAAGYGKVDGRVVSVTANEDCLLRHYTAYLKHNDA
jgi:hypothetical protein